MISAICSLNAFYVTHTSIKMLISLLLFYPGEASNSSQSLRSNREYVAALAGALCVDRQIPAKDIDITNTG